MTSQLRGNNRNDKAKRPRTTKRSLFGRSTRKVKIYKYKPPKPSECTREGFGVGAQQ